MISVDKYNNCVVGKFNNYTPYLNELISCGLEIMGLKQ